MVAHQVEIGDTIGGRTVVTIDYCDNNEDHTWEIIFGFEDQTSMTVGEYDRV
jgi:hypothetical protein